MSDARLRKAIERGDLTFEWKLKPGREKQGGDEELLDITEEEGLALLALLVGAGRVDDELAALVEMNETEGEETMEPKKPQPPEAKEDPGCRAYFLRADRLAPMWIVRLAGGEDLRETLAPTANEALERFIIWLRGFPFDRDELDGSTLVRVDVGIAPRAARSAKPEGGRS